MSNQKIVLNPGLHKITAAQARSLAVHANNVHEGAGDLLQVPDVLTVLVLSGLSIELYFKSIMLAGQRGLVLKGHDLKTLYREFPGFLKKSLSKNYLFQTNGIDLPRVQFAAIMKNEKPEAPSNKKPDTKYDTFKNAISSISNIFTRSRYFYEEVNVDDYAYIEYPIDSIKAVIVSLDSTYESFLNDEFAGALAK